MANHHFSPSQYHGTIAERTPVLRIADGDTVTTTTVDARGLDAERHAATPPGNPQTGPFYVEGAEPGDTLALRLDRIVPNRSYGGSSTLLAPNVVDPAYVPSLGWPADGDTPLAEWEIDVAAGTARLVAPTTRLGQLTLPLAPMLGCFGVAPARGQAISTATSAEHGGNMDYRGFTSGVIAYFPVFVPGALIHLGDGHAIQGDGEIAGTGIEISMEVQFTAWLHKRRRSFWPRGENAEYIFTVGNARPLDQALQHATTEMQRWLIDDYGLDSTSAGILLGQCVEYDLGNIFDPAYTMVCKLRKRLLPARV